jgi:hypothetical protein
MPPVSILFGAFGLDIIRPDLNLFAGRSTREP